MVIPVVHSREEARKALIAIGQEIIRQADDITRQVDNVSFIKIDAVVESEPNGTISVNVTKNYAARFEEKGGQIDWEALKGKFKDNN